MDDRIHKGIFSFLSNNGCDIHEMRRILSLFGLDIGLKRPKNCRKKWYAMVSEEANKDFKRFKKIYNLNKIRPKTKTQTYDEWYEESSFDGSFAYNGVADDF